MLQQALIERHTTDGVMDTSSASPPAPVNNRRLPKSRNGCQTCKTRKLKCDETKPACKNCLKRGIVCAGYQKLLKWSTKHEVVKTDGTGSIQFAVQFQTFPSPPAESVGRGRAGKSPVSEATHGSSPKLPSPKVVYKSDRRTKRQRLQDSTDSNSNVTGEVVVASPCDPDGLLAAQPAWAARPTDLRPPIFMSPAFLLEHLQSHDEFLQDRLQRGAQPSNITQPKPLHGRATIESVLNDAHSIESNARSDVPPSLLPAISTNACKEGIPKNDDQVIQVPPVELSDSPSESICLLTSFCRLPPATPQSTMMDMGSFLIQHYFQDVCTIFSSFDSMMNPFRVSISRLWGDSAPIYFAIQSMAAAHLANTDPQMAMVGVAMQKKANESLNQELQQTMTGHAKPERALLTLLLLGLSACWHRPGDLGLNYLRTARGLMTNKLLHDKPPNTKEQQRQAQFFEEALVYWEMMVGFVSPKDGKPKTHSTSTSSTSKNFPLPREDPKQSKGTVLPHPWTGVAPRAQILLAEVGRLVREERLAQKSDRIEVYLPESLRRFKLAQALEEELLSIEPPEPETLIDVQDENTSKRDFLTIAEATRCTALLDLYRIFPDLLNRRMGLRDDKGVRRLPLKPRMPAPPFVNEDVAFNWLFDTAAFSTPINASIPVIESLDHLNAPIDPALTEFPIVHPALDPAVPAAHPDPPSRNTAFLNSLATHILTHIETLPSQSGTRFLQLMLIVISASELRFTAPGTVNLDFFDPASDDAKVAHSREFAEKRLTEHSVRLPAKPVNRMLEIVREVWRRADEGVGLGNDRGVFWLDVVVERHWETVMG